eukprot:maker-scaffold_1-snap-gene-2.4-mRNA-1 protein AED:0.23 eAED:0.23 QI:39/1/1/1/1/1/5/56/380
MRSIFTMVMGRKSLEIGPVENVKHVQHLDLNMVQVDSNAPLGLKGLPQDYEALLETSGITKEEAMNNKNIVVDVLEFHMKGVPKIPTRASLKKNINQALRIEEKDPNIRFKRNRKLGEGAGGVVWECTDTKTGDLVAVKSSPITELDELKNEIALQNLSQHKNVVRYLETYKYNEELWIVIELMDGGALTQVLGPGIIWDEPEIAYVFRECLFGLENLHANHRMHRDIKSDNILFDYNGRIKLADFGFAVNLTTNNLTRTSVVGTPYWMAPELIKGSNYDQKVDVWSMGITCLEMADGYPPLLAEQVPPLKALLKISVNPPPTLKKPRKWSKEFNHVLKMSLYKKPEDRASTRDLLIHPFIGRACKQHEFSVFVKKLMAK